MAEKSRTFPDWDALYKNQSVESMPWYSESLDPDLMVKLDQLNIGEGVFLDLGTGPGTQAIKLFERGFDVTGSDLSVASIEKASLKYNVATKNRLKFVVDDILDSQLPNSEFNYIYDRGCFHVLPPDKRGIYVDEVSRILKKGGLFFLKCFSEKEPEREMGPYRFTIDIIKDMFENKGFKLQSFKETVYQGTLNPLPKALFIVFLK